MAEPLSKLIHTLIDSPVRILSEPQLFANLGAYPHKYSEAEKVRAIIDLMELLWHDGNSAQLLQFFAKFDRFLLAIGNRDHFIHQFEVFLLGWFIIHALVEKGYHIEDFMAFNSSIFLQTWLITAMSHDLGFPLQEEPEIIKVLKALHQSVGTSTIASEYTKLEQKLSIMGRNGRKALMDDLLRGEGSQISRQIKAGVSMTTGFSRKETQKLWREIVKSPKNHGLISALILGRELSSFFVPNGNFQEGEANNSFELKRFQLLLAAITLHHLKEDSENAVKNIRFTANPFAYLLYIADNLQEWGRDLGGWKNTPETSLDGFDYDGSQITLTFRLSHDDWAKDDVERNILAEIERADDRLKWPQRPHKGLTIKAMYNSNSRLIKSREISLAL